MLELENITGKAKTKEATVNIPAWGGDVKLRTLTCGQAADVTAAQSKGEQGLALLLTAHFSLVEPAMSMKQLSELPQEMMTGVSEIITEVGKLDKPKK